MYFDSEPNLRELYDAAGQPKESWIKRNLWFYVMLRAVGPFAVLLLLFFAISLFRSHS